MGCRKFSSCWNDFYDVIAERSEPPTHDHKIGICTDGNDQNKGAMLRHYREDCTHYGMVIKDKISQTVVGVHAEKVFGNMPYDEIHINNVDGFCSALRERLKFSVRKSKAFAKKRKTIRDLVGIYQAYHNLIKTVDGATPCMKECITTKMWSWEKLFHTRLSYV